jgi:hypothetical protein
VAPHPGGLQLEQAGRLARREQVERLLVVERDVLAPHRDAALLADEAEGAIEDRQVRQPEEVELQEAELLELLVLVLRLDRGGVALRSLEGDEVGERVARDDDAGGMRSGRANEPFDALGKVQEALDAWVRLELLQLGDEPARLGERRRPGSRRDDLRHAVRVRVRHAKDARGVADGGTREHGVERDDLRDAVRPVLLRDVGDDLVAPGIHEVDVDVRLRESLEVQEPLEQQLVPDGIDVGQADRVADEAAAGGAADRREDPALLREADEILNDEDVRGVPGLRDHPELALHPLAKRRRERPVLRLHPCLRHRAQLRVGRPSAGHLEVRQAQLARQHEIDARSDLRRALDRGEIVREERGHLVRGL